MIKRIAYILLTVLATYGLHAQPVSHLYYLSIGNGYYTDDHYSNIDDVNYSADTVARILQRYGTGRACLSGSRHILSKQEIMAQVDSFLATLTADTLGVGVLYYCGHGQSDFDGNMYMIPGVVSMQSDSLMRIEAIDKLVNVSEIQTKFVSMTMSMAMTDNPVMYSRCSLMMLRAMEDRKLVPPSDTIEQMKKILLNAAGRSGKRNMPRLLIIADCCYDHLWTDKSAFTDQRNAALEDAFTKKYVSKTTPDLPEHADALQQFAASFVGKADLAIAIEIIKNIYGCDGNKVVYGAPIDSPVHMVQMANSTWYTGPLARRLMMFFDAQRQSFTTYDLLDKLSLPSFDSHTGRAYMEGQMRYGKIWLAGSFSPAEVAESDRLVLKKKKGNK